MQTANRIRKRDDRFTLRGWVYPFHRLVDGPVLARLDPDSSQVQWLPLHGRKDEPVEVRPGDVQSITKQVFGIDLPPCRGASQEEPEEVAETEAVEEEPALEAQPEEADEPVLELTRVVEEPEFAEFEDDEGTPIPADLNEKLFDHLDDDEPMPDALRLVAPKGVDNSDSLKDYFRKKQQSLHHRLVDGGVSLPPLSFEEQEELNVLQKFIGWFS